MRQLLVLPHPHHQHPSPRMHWGRRITNLNDQTPQHSLRHEHRATEAASKWKHCILILAILCLRIGSAKDTLASVCMLVPTTVFYRPSHPARDTTTICYLPRNRRHACKTVLCTKKQRKTILTAAQMSALLPSVATLCNTACQYSYQAATTPRTPPHSSYTSATATPTSLDYHEDGTLFRNSA